MQSSAGRCLGHLARFLAQSKSLEVRGPGLLWCCADGDDNSVDRGGDCEDAGAADGDDHDSD